MENQNIRFTAEQFDHSSELPEHYNAGNRLYGRDVAEFLAAGLAPHQLSTHFYDEDWGWVVECKAPDGRNLEIGIYNLSYGGEDPENSNQWGLWLRMYEPVKWLGLFSKRREVACTPHVLEALHGLLREAGIQPESWDDTPA